MSQNKQKFTRAFKNETATLVIDQGYSVTEACQAMNVSETSLRRWVKQLQCERNGITPKSKAMTPEHQKIQELEKKVKQLELQKEILKKASALLMSEEFKNIR